MKRQNETVMFVCSPCSKNFKLFHVFVTQRTVRIYWYAKVTAASAAAMIIFFFFLFFSEWSSPAVAVAICYRFLNSLICEQELQQ